MIAARMRDTIGLLVVMSAFSCEITPAATGSPQRFVQPKDQDYPSFFGTIYSASILAVDDKLPQQGAL